MSEEIEVKSREHKEHVALSSAASQKINRWFEQINAKKKVKLSKKAFVSWYIESAPDNLSNSEINAVIDQFYDPEAHLRQMLREVRKAKRDGQTGRSMELILRERKSEIKKTAEVSMDEPAEDVDQT